jgi:hypothetical protein
MENTELKQVSKGMLPAIRSVAGANVIKSAINSLLIWGGINLGGWLLLGRESLDSLKGLSGASIDPGMFILAYGAAIIGLAMLIFAVVGFLTRSPIVVLLDSFALMGVGAWNIIHDFFAMSVLEPYGYTIEKPSVFWIILGLCQVVWGFREFLRFKKILLWSKAKNIPAELKPAEQALINFIKEPEDLERGRLKAAITIKGPMGLNILDRTEYYSGQLNSDHILFLTNTIDNFFCVEKKAASTAVYNGNGTMVVKTDDGEKVLALGPLSILAIKKWADKPVTISDIQYLVSQKKASLEILKPFLSNGNSSLKAAAISVLEASQQTEARELIPQYLNDSNADVRTAAVRACTALKIGSVHNRVIELLRDSCTEARMAAAKYFQYFPTPFAQVALKEVLAVEKDKRVQREFDRVFKTIEKM